MFTVEHESSGVNNVRDFLLPFNTLNRNLRQVSLDLLFHSYFDKSKRSVGQQRVTNPLSSLIATHSFLIVIPAAQIYACSSSI